MKLSNDNWRSLAKSLQIIGGVCCAVIFVSSFVLIAYYSAKRPTEPRPEFEMTVGLSWTHPVRYGTQQDENRLQWPFELFFPSFFMIALGEMIRIYKLRDYSNIRTRPKVPWDHKWGP
jgi:hypothetical protein